MVHGLNVKPMNGYYIESVPLNGNFKDCALLDESPDEGLNPRGRTFTAGRAVDGVGLPTRMQVMDRQKHPLGDFDESTLLNISNRAKALIEGFEPGVHQFFPVTFLDIDGQHLEDRWFFVICNRLDSVHREKVQGMLLSGGKMWRPAKELLRKYPEEIPEGYDLTIEPKLVFSLEQIGNHHIWIDKHLSGGGRFLGEKLADAIVSNRLSGCRLSESGAEAA